MPISGNLNIQYGAVSSLNSGKKRRDITVEAVSGVTDWRNVVSNLATAMTQQLQTNASLATVSYNATSSINGTASIEVTYNNGTIPGNIQVGAGTYANSGGNGRFTVSRNSAFFTPSTNPAPIEQYLSPFGNHGNKLAGEPEKSGGRATIVASGSNPADGTEIFLHPTLAMDGGATADIVVVSYLSGSQPS